MKAKVTFKAKDDKYSDDKYGIYKNHPYMKILEPLGYSKGTYSRFLSCYFKEVKTKELGHRIIIENGIARKADVEYYKTFFQWSDVGCSYTSVAFTNEELEVLDRAGLDICKDQALELRQEITDWYGDM
jgi:hypothetical protein